MLSSFLHDPPAVLGSLILVIFLMATLLAPLITPQNPYDLKKLTLESFLKPPLWMEGGQAPFLLGTDDQGRDILSTIIYGCRTSLIVGFGVVLIAGTFGVAIGLLAGYYGGWLDLLAMRVMDLMLAFPSILMAIVVVAILGPSLTNAMIAVGIMAVPQYARIVRASVLSVRGLEYMQASRALGAADPRILARAILPNIAGPIIVTASLGLATAILDAAGLSFLGLGAQPPTPEWGSMLSQGRELVLIAPWVLTAPGVAVFLAVLGFNLVGDALRDLLDPRRT
jgi:ABC-type dipeptide/oligopeptide/nickel transport system permease subunit